MKLGSTRFWLSVSALLLVPAGAERSPRAGQNARAKSSARRNELTLAGIRPGRDSMERVTKRIGTPVVWQSGEPAFWFDKCRKQRLSADVDVSKQVQSLRVEAWPSSLQCSPGPGSPWRTGLGLRLDDACSRVPALYGKPDSRSPSTEGGQPLELLYYAFDWAGPDVPQVMQVACTAEKDGRAARVVEITLAASSL